MLGNVMVPADFSDNAKKIILCLAKIPGIHEIVLGHVVDAPVTRSLLLIIKELFKVLYGNDSIVSREKQQILAGWTHFGME